jgi:O-antigen ligase
MTMPATLGPTIARGVPTPRPRARATVLDGLAIMLFLWHASGIEQYLISQGGPAPILFQAASLGLLCGVITFRALARVPITAGRSRELLVFAGILALYAAWTVIDYLYGAPSPEADDLLRSKIIAVLFILIFPYVFSDLRVKYAFGLGCGFLACFGAGMNVFDLLTSTFSTTAGRAAGFYLNPNIAGFMIPCLGLIAMPALSRWGRYLVWAMVVVGTVVTFSRAAYLFLIVGTIGLTWLGYLGSRRRRYLFPVLALALAAAFVVALSTGALYSAVAASPLGPHLNENAIQRLGGGEQSALENDSTTQRAELVTLALEHFARSPLIGSGFNATNDWEIDQSTHNIYLLFMVEGGLIGLGVYLLLLSYLTFRARDVGVLLALLIALQGLFNHNLLDDLQQSLVFAALMIIGTAWRPAQDRGMAGGATAQSRLSRGEI